MIYQIVILYDLALWIFFYGFSPYSLYIYILYLTKAFIKDFLGKFVSKKIIIIAKINNKKLQQVTKIIKQFRNVKRVQIIILIIGII